jgi:transposase
MVFDPASLPRDPDRLIAIIIDLRERNENLQGQVAALQRVVFGPRSEKLAVDPAQLELMLPDVEFASIMPAANDDDPGPAIAASHAARPKAARNIGALPKHLPRCETVIEPDSKTCPCCQLAMHLIGEDVTEQLDVIPAILQVKRIRRPRYGCRGCE